MFSVLVASMSVSEVAIESTSMIDDNDGVRIEVSDLWRQRFLTCRASSGD